MKTALCERLGIEIPIVLARMAGAIVLHTVGNGADARRTVDCGVDVVVALGWEAGGHVRGAVATMALVPAVVDAVGATPVVAAGGIADGRGLAAALVLGAAGAWIGTRFLASTEATIHPEYRQRPLAATENETVWLENLFDVGCPDPRRRGAGRPLSTPAAERSLQARRYATDAVAARRRCPFASGA